jgi:hypothetical protein
MNRIIPLLVLVLIALAGCKTAKVAPKAHMEGPPLPPGATNGTPGTNAPWSGTNYHVLDTEKWFGTDTNHFYTLEVASELLAPVLWQTYTNFTSPKVFTIRNTNQVMFIRAGNLGGFVIWAHGTNGADHVSFRKTNEDGWGWPTFTNATVTDITGNHVVSYMGRAFDAAQGTGTVSIPWPAYSTSYRFDLWTPEGATNGLYPLWLKEGFTP